MDTENLSYTNTIGDPELAVVWTDPNFDPGEDAFYYVRVIEIPTPRWSAYDRKFFKNEDRVGEGFPLTTQDQPHLVYTLVQADRDEVETRSCATPPLYHIG